MLQDLYMKLLLPQEVKDRIKSKCPKKRYRESFVVSDLQSPLHSFIEKDLDLLDSRLFQKYKRLEKLSERTLSYAFSEEGNPNDGAEDDLRDLLCFFGFKKNWLDTLYSLGQTEEEIIRRTQKLKSKNINLSDFSKIQTSPSSQPFQSMSIQKVYIELVTRKAAIPFDEENDVIVEIYDSWYKIFCMIREELKIIPTNKKSEIEILFHIMNNVLRPHLTIHQAAFRAWFASAMKMNSRNLPPQILQKGYPKYPQLISSVKDVNRELKVSVIRLSKLMSASTK